MQRHPPHNIWNPYPAREITRTLVDPAFEGFSEAVVFPRDHDHLARARGLGKLYLHQADAARAINNDRLAELYVKALDRMRRAGKRFRKRRVFKAHLVRDLVYVGIFHLDIFRKTAVYGNEAGEDAFNGIRFGFGDV